MLLSSFFVYWEDSFEFPVHKKYIKDAKNDGDEILVFPEYTLT